MGQHGAGHGADREQHGHRPWTNAAPARSSVGRRCAARATRPPASSARACQRRGPRNTIVELSESSICSRGRGEVVDHVASVLLQSVEVSTSCRMTAVTYRDRGVMAGPGGAGAGGHGRAVGGARAVYGARRAGRAGPAGSWPPPQCLTVLGRLERKGLVSRHASTAGHIATRHPARGRTNYRHASWADALAGAPDRGGGVGPLPGGMPPEEQAALRDLLSVIPNAGPRCLVLGRAAGRARQPGARLGPVAGARPQPAALLLWQAVGLAGGLALLGAGVSFAARPTAGPSLPAAVGALGRAPAAMGLAARARAVAAARAGRDRRAGRPAVRGARAGRDRPPCAPAGGTATCSTCWPPRGPRWPARGCWPIHCRWPTACPACGPGWWSARARSPHCRRPSWPPYSPTSAPTCGNATTWWCLPFVAWGATAPWYPVWRAPRWRWPHWSRCGPTTWRWHGPATWRWRVPCAGSAARPRCPAGPR